MARHANDSDPCRKVPVVAAVVGFALTAWLLVEGPARPARESEARLPGDTASQRGGEMRGGLSGELSHQAISERGADEAFGRRKQEPAASRESPSALSHVTSPAGGDSTPFSWTPDYGADWGREGHAALRAFSGWVNRSRAAGRWDLGEGRALAAARSEALYELMKADPEAAIRAAVPLGLRDELPAGVRAGIETFLEGTGRYRVGVICGQQSPPAVASDDRLRWLTFQDMTYRVGVYGQRLGLPSNDQLPFHGIALGDRLAIEQHPLRTVGPAPGGGWVVNLGGDPLTVPNSGAAALLAARQLSLESRPGTHVLASGAPVGASPKAMSLAGGNTMGMKDLLVIRVDFSDSPGVPKDTLTGATMTESWLAGRINGVIQNDFTEYSYGKFGVAADVSDVTPVYRLPRSAAYYNNRDDWDLLASHAKSAARNDGYVLGRYDHYLIVFTEVNAIDFAGLATLGANDFVLINGYFDSPTVVHELGHNLGLDHANLWVADSASSPVGRGSSEEYGDVFDVMGAGNWAWDIPDETLHPNPWFLHELGWLEDRSVETVAASGVYRVHRYDTGSANANDTLALRIFRRSGQYFWVSFRADLRGIGEASDMAEGAYVVAQGLTKYANSQLIDLGADASDVDPPDASLNVGESFNDAVGRVVIRTVGKGGSGHSAWLDIEIDVPEPPTVSPVTPPAMIVSGPVMIDLDASDSPSSFRVFGLPPGLSYNKTTGVISGMPNVAGTFTITVYAYNATGRSQPLVFQIVVDPLAPGQRGSVNGLVAGQSPLAGGLGGRIDVSIASTGVYSAALRVGRSLHRWKSRVNAQVGGNARLTRTIKRKGLPDLLVDLELSPAGVLAGTVSESGLPLNSEIVQGRKIPWHAKNNPATGLLGAYNGAIQLPGGEVGNLAVPQGGGTLRVLTATSGRVVWSGYTGDGSPVSGASLAWDDGTLAFHQLTRDGLSSLLGLPRIDGGIGALSGGLRWRRLATNAPKARLYPAGFAPLSVTLAGARYTPPPTGDLLPGFTAQAENAALVFSQGLIENTERFPDLDQGFTVNAKHLAVPSNPPGPANPASVKLSFQAKTGAYGGSFVLSDPDPRNAAKRITRKVTFRGLIVPGQAQAPGLFLLGELPPAPGVLNPKALIHTGKSVLAPQ